jgi:hypothetical protein
MYQNQNTRRLILVFTVSANPDFIMTANAPFLADRLFIQMLAGGSGMGEIFVDVPVTDPGGTQPAASTLSTVCGQPIQLAPATATSPGGSYTEDPSTDPWSGTDLRNYAVTGSNAGDQILVVAHLKI